jgi:hypothetical protein
MNLPPYRDDGWGCNVFQDGDTWTFVYICPKCGANEVIRGVESEEEANRQMESIILDHKEGGNCPKFDWRRDRIEREREK